MYNSDNIAKYGRNNGRISIHRNVWEPDYNRIGAYNVN